MHHLYCCYLKATIEYCSVVYHHMLTLEKENELEKLNRLSARICFQGDLPTDALMEANGLEPLKERRTRRCDAFLRKALASPRFGPRWFPKRQGTRTGLRSVREIQESRSRTNRRFNSPLEFLRRRANDLGAAAP